MQTSILKYNVIITKENKQYIAYVPTLDLSDFGKTIEKANHFKPQYFLITILISGVVGATAGILADTEWQVSFLAGGVYPE